MFKFCSSPWTTIAINSRGAVSPCLCSRQHRRGYKGNITEQSVTEIMKSEWMQDFKNSIIDQSYQYCNKDYCNHANDPAKFEQLDFVDDIVNMPTELMLQLDANCNLKCASCRDRSIYSADINENAYKILIQLANDYKNFTQPVTVFCDGLGDVFASAAYQKFLWSDKIPACFNFAITTNGNLVTKNRALFEKIRDQISTVIISLDSATAETYKKIRGGNFQIVIDGINMLKSMEIQVRTEFVVQFENYLEIPMYYDLIESLGVDGYGLNLLDRWGHMTPIWWQTNDIFTNPNTDYEFLKNLLPTIEKKNPEFAWSLKHNLQKNIPIFVQ